MEAATGAAFAALAEDGPAAHGAALVRLRCRAAGAVLIDWDTTLLPDVINQPLLWAGLLSALLGWTIPLQQSLIGALAGYLSCGRTGSSSSSPAREGMGFGDFKLLAALGAWLGW